MEKEEAEREIKEYAEIMGITLFHPPPRQGQELAAELIKLVELGVPTDNALGVIFNVWEICDNKIHQRAYRKGTLTDELISLARLGVPTDNAIDVITNVWGICSNEMYQRVYRRET